MSRSVIAVYSGTFDPLTLGHEDVVRRAAALFDTVVIAVARAVHKKTLLDLDQRLLLAQAALADCPNVRALPFDGPWFEPALQEAARLVPVGGWIYLEAPAAWSDEALAPFGLEPVRHLKAGAVHAHLLRRTA